RRNALQEHIQQEVAKVLGLAMSQAPAPDVPLMQAGVDSLMSVHVRNALQASLEVQLPVTVLFDNPTISLLADHLARLLSSDGGEKTSETSPEDLESMLNELESLPEEEVARRLRE
ncbi:MAG TPA: acyl carrier protein, partial [Myxococcales bacterium]|nr:acyl carrier protein [Myxococcales bacterium]